jgi:Tfp pilus assembly protein PilX
MEGRTKIEKAKRDQSRAIQAAENATQRLRDRERMAGIGTGIAGTDIAVNAMAANTVAAKQKADAANIRSGVLGQAVEADADINAALAEVDGKKAPQSFEEKMAALKSI